VRARRGVLLLAAALSLAIACASPEPDASGTFPRTPILLIGLDGFEWNAALPLLREERLPAIASLMRRGTYGTLETFPGRVSPALWTSIATGKDVEKHGIYDFLKQRNPPVFYASGDRKTKAFWNILSERGRSVHTVGWFVTYPAEPVNGVMVAQANTQSVRKTHRTQKGALLPGLAGQVYPPAREDDVFAIMDAVEADLDTVVAERLETSHEHPPERLREVIEASSWAFRADTIYERTALMLAAEGPPDLLAVYFGSTDVVAHRFWPSARPRTQPGRFFVSPDGRGLERHLGPGTLANRFFGAPFWRAMEPQPGDPWSVRVLRRTYESADAAIGRLVAAMPRETTVILVSDHGFRPWGHEDGPDAFFVAAGPSVRPLAGPEPRRLTRAHLRRRGSSLDVTPTLLALSGVPVALDMDGRVLDRAFASLPGTTRPTAVASHDSAEWLKGRSAPTGPAPGASEDDEERVEQLKALGYIQ
jgi:hypothetical protein